MFVIARSGLPGLAEPSSSLTVNVSGVWVFSVALIKQGQKISLEGDWIDCHCTAPVNPQYSGLYFQYITLLITVGRGGTRYYLGKNGVELT